MSPTEYRRELDLERAMATVSYQKGNTRYKREYFASYPDQAIVVCYTANQKMKVKIGFTSELSHQAYVEGNALRVEGQCPEHVEPSYIESDNPVIQGTRGLRFQTMITVQNTDGTIQEKEGKVVISDATTIYLAIQSISADKQTNVVPALPVIQKSYEELKEAHYADYKELFGRVC